jgi:hypothetical protein
MDERERRIGLNEALFRAVNEAVESISDEMDVPAFEVICECGNLTCTQRFEITSRQYADLRSESDEFAVLPGHELPDVEEVIAKSRNYNVVKKTSLAARSLAEQTDPRTD